MNTKTLLALAFAGLFAATAISAPVGVTVNGVALDDGGSTGEGWAYEPSTSNLVLSGSGTFTLSGGNTAGKVCVVAATGVTSTVTVSNLTLMTTNKNQCVFTLETNAVVSLVLAGTNSLASGRSRAGLEVAAGRTLYITNAPGDAAGALMATGGDEGAGIGGGSGGAGGTVTISGGIVTANGSEFFGAGIGGGAGGGGGAVTISGGAVTANGGEMGAGIGTGGYAGDDSGVVIISGGAVTANGGNFAAGIGGGDGDAGGTTTITGGEVSATGGKYGAGIGGGNNDANTNGIAGSGGTVNIAGGRVTATGGKCAAGIGGGTGQQLAGSTGAVLAVSGGTVLATGGTGGAPGIGPGLGNVEEGETGDLPDASGWSRFTGGSIRIDGGYAAYAPSNGTARVWCVTVPDLTPNAPIIVTALNPYGVNDLFADNSGKLYLWLPNDNYDFTAGGVGYEATVANADTTATPKSPTPPASRSYLTFSSTNAFTIKPQAASWNGTLEYSTDTTNWTLFTIAGAAAATNAAGVYKLYICGSSNTCIVGNKDADGWTINAPTGTVACSGNIESLLDYTKVLANEHPAMADWCFANLFRYCPALNSAPELPAMTLTMGCYYSMFTGGTGLTEAPELPATNLADRCYQYMFSSCSGLGQTPALPATTLSPNCYQCMFQGCSGLTNTPKLSATTLTSYCYNFMFASCSGLTQAPELPATNLATACYQYMFSNCSGLTNVPALEATKLASYCYASMFQGCTGLTRLPELPATQLANYCYQGMFRNCSGITLYEDGIGPTWGIPAGATEKTGWNSGMLSGTGGDFTNNPVIGALYYYTSPIANPYLTFSSANAFTIKPQAASWNGTLEYSTDTTNWALFTTAGAAADNGSGGNYQLYLRGANNTQITGSGVDGWTINAPTGTVACYGNIETLLDYATVTNGSHPAMANYCFAKLFYGCAALNSAPALPATNLTTGCYNLLFYDCTGLLGAPELPAMTMAAECYGSMFRGCTSLTNTPNLPATTLAPFCYYAMFSGCVSLTETPVLPAMTMMMGCYSIMFSGCTSLTETPALSAMILADYCYDSMFRDCTGLTRLPTLPATNLTEDCYRYMFTDCTGIVLNEAGPGTPWGIPAGAQAAANWNQFMLNGTGGDFTDDPVIGVTYYLPLVAPVAPSGVSASDGTFTNKIRITWNASDLATGYTVWRHTANSSAAATEIGSTTGTSYDDVATVAKTTYYYWVKATNAAGVSGFSAPDSGWRAEPKPPKPAAPTGVAASDGAHTDKIRVTWKASVGATSYKVYRHTINNPNAAAQIGTSASTTYNDTTAKTGLTYYYWVKAVNEGGASGFSALDTGYLGVVGPLVTVNGMVGNNIRIPANKPITITATMMNLPRAYLGVPVDWWVAAYVHQGGLWFYFDTNFNLVQFDGNLANCRPAYQGPLFNVPPLPLVEKMLLPRGTYNVWFAVDYPMDGKIDLNGLILLSVVTIVVE